MKHTKIYNRIVQEWSDKNEVPLDHYSSNSTEKKFWQCQNGHEWVATIKSRYSSKHIGCPYCSGKMPIKGVNDVATIMPKLTEEFHPTKNGSLTLSEFSIGSEQKVWWRCQAGHEWKARINHRTRGEGCPVCNGRIPGLNDHNLLTEFPQVAALWNYEKNELSPEKYRPHSRKFANWKCSQGHEWVATIHEMTAKRRLGTCPYCSGRRPIKGVSDLASNRVDLANEWDYEKNKKDPSEYKLHSQYKAYWICPAGHTYKASIANRTNGKGCPKCYRKK